MLGQRVSARPVGLVLLCVSRVTDLTCLNTEGQRRPESSFIQMHCDCAGYFESLQDLSPPACHGHVRSWSIFQADDHKAVKLTLDVSD